MKVAIQDSFDPVTKEAIGEFEQELGMTLPEDYKRFLLAHNGGTFADKVAAFYEAAGGEDFLFAACYSGFLGLKADCRHWDLRHVIRIVQGPLRSRRADRIPTELIPICRVPGGMVCLGVEGPTRGRVFDWDGEEPEDAPWDNLTLISNSFTAFLAGLEYTDEEIPRREPADILKTVATGDLAALRRYLAEGGDVNRRSPEGWTLLMIASLERRVEAARALLRAGADPQATNNEGQTPLHLTRSTDVTKLLLAHGANVQAADRNGYTPLIIAAKDGEAYKVRILLRHGARLDPKAKDGATVFSVCTSPVSKEDVLPILKEFQAKDR